MYITVCSLHIHISKSVLYAVRQVIGALTLFDVLHNKQQAKPFGLPPGKTNHLKQLTS